MFRQPPRMMNGMMMTNGQYFPPQQTSLAETTNSEPSSDLHIHNKNFLSSSVLLNRILEKRNITHMPPMGMNTRNFYTNLDLMTIKWAASLNRRMFILFFSIYIIRKSFFRRQMRGILHCFLSSNSYSSTYLWYFDCKFTSHYKATIVTLLQF